ncbi:(Fe-S)-binding protein [Desulfallas sp. Bu1-1]|uniref:(Fe-S)-binding protein n=1 Tax=Desulfallas sp. Bu1-1 TaxID=2787620 RepID=UPI00189E3065|nr:(Fe-S)-binding protein [Desulfallas sp. Bu1-1]MBF7082774.1 (Fe-S)-binding protein [Desulfallas sp. Bu1-1]
MEEIQKKLKELYYQSDNCIRCGRCTTVCPTFAVTGKESMVARGRVRLAREYVEGNLELSNRLKLYFDLCLGCNACLDICPPRIKTAELLNLIKTEIIQKNGSPFLDSMLLNMIISRPENFRRAMVLLDISRKLGINKLFPATLKDKEKILPVVPQKSFKELYRHQSQRRTGKKHRVGYFTGCLTNTFYPEIAFDTIKVLEYHNCEVIIPMDTVCCGLPHRTMGYWHDSQRLARKNIELFLKSQVDYIVTDCGTCGYALKNYTEHFTEPGDIKYARFFSERVFDINEFLVNVTGLKVGNKLLNGCTATYHESCHLNRGQKISLQPREILKAIPGLKYIELPEANWCCGAAGSFSFKHQDIARKILEKKISNIGLTEAQYVTAGCPACLIQLDFGRRIFALEFQVKHPVQLLAESI